ncbi:MAG TPA: hypothetical protein VMQ45_03350 [Burkholderiaceae bacterium]|nr:hypothetical protein [Burkholderiaceae bacterium]
MTDQTTHPATRPASSGSAAAATLPYPLAARIANVALTAQVQMAYALAIAASENAERAATCIERTWPDTPVRSLVVQAYRIQARRRQDAARDVLARARQRCGLAYARLVP